MTVLTADLLLPAALAARLTAEQRQALLEAPREQRLTALAAALALPESETLTALAAAAGLDIATNLAPDQPICRPCPTRDIEDQAASLPRLRARTIESASLNW